jgi:2-iminobutanoate/2-iminopropanoate deaminase
MTSSFNSSMSAAAEPLASRREIVTAAVTVARPSLVQPVMRRPRPHQRFASPIRLGCRPPPTYSHVVEVDGPHRTVYLAGQTGVDATGKIAEGFRAQAVQVMENLTTALTLVGGGELVVKLNSYLTNIETNGTEFREVRGSYFPNKQALPASTLVQVPRLANPAFLLEIEAIAILPPKA